MCIGFPKAIKNDPCWELLSWLLQETRKKLILHDGKREKHLLLQRTRLAANPSGPVGFYKGQQLLLSTILPCLCFLSSTKMCSCRSPESTVTRADTKNNRDSKNMLMMLSILPVLQFHSIICTFSPDFHYFRALFIKCSIINQAPSLTVLMRLYLQHPSPKLFSTQNPHSYCIKLLSHSPSYSGLGAFEMIPNKHKRSSWQF